MNCPYCKTKNPESEKTCSNCGKPINVKDPRAGDPLVSKGIAWALIAMGVFGLIFVIANSSQDWHTALDYVAPVAVLIIGAAALISQARK